MTERSHSRNPVKPKLGQNFLVSPSAPKAIVDALGDLSDATVLEIGAGQGVITRLLAARSKRLIAVELDSVLASALRSELAGENNGEAGIAKPENLNLEILNQDILSLDLTALALRETGVPTGKLRVVGNLPYYITSDILLHLFAHHAAIDRAVLMVQREVAERIVAEPGVRDYGLLSATTQMYGRPEFLFHLPPTAFSPPPNVYSTVFRLTMQPRFAELEVDEQGFLRFLRQVFAQKRKTLANNLRAALHGGEEVQAALAACHLDPLVRAEAVSLESMAGVFRFLRTPTAS